MSLVGRRKTGAPGLFVINTPHDNVSVSGGGNNVSSSFDVALAKTIVITAKATSVTFRIEVYTSYDGTEWDTVPYASFTVEGGQTVSVPITPGVSYLRVRAVNTGASSGNITTKLVLTF